MPVEGDETKRISAESRHQACPAAACVREATATNAIRRRPKDTSATHACPIDNYSTSLVLDPAIVEAPKSKRVSLSLAGLPPPSSIPSLMAMSVGNGWVEGLGKKWEELSKGPESTYAAIFFLLTCH